jgi:hypothetical protein
MERTITIKIEDARKWYLSGNEDLRELALNAFNEDELIVAGLPTTAEEFTEKYGEVFLSSREIDEYGAHAMLRKLRDLYRGCDEWGYRERLGGRYQYCIVLMYDERHTPTLRISSLNSYYNEFLSFDDYKVAEKFLACFETLIVKAGDLI